MEAHDVLAQEAASLELLTHRFGVEAGRVRHQYRRRPAHRLIVDVRVEVEFHAPFQAPAVDVDQGLVATGLDAGEGDRKQLRQKRPVEVARIDPGRQEGEAE